MCVHIALLSLRIYLGRDAVCHFILCRDFCFIIIIGGFIAFAFEYVQMLSVHTLLSVRNEIDFEYIT